MFPSFCSFLGFLFSFISSSAVSGGLQRPEAATEAQVSATYSKREVFITMRDSVRLYTAIYEPYDFAADSSLLNSTLADGRPVIVLRTPYKPGPFGDELSSVLWKDLRYFSARRYIVVIQSVRGTYLSEGDYVQMRPVYQLERTTHGTVPADEATDSYDTVDWLLANTCNNGNVGFIGVSYPGFYAMMAGLSSHPAIKAISPQAPATDWFLGDDIHHNGAFMVLDAYSFLSGHARPRPEPVQKRPSATKFFSYDVYHEFLSEAPTVGHLTEMFDGSLPFWNQIVQHPDYDSFWQNRNLCNSVEDYMQRNGVLPAVLITAGSYDAEDLYGPAALFRTLKSAVGDSSLYFAFGPWYHGGWHNTSYSGLASMRTCDGISVQYMSEVEFSFFSHYLEDGSELAPPSPVTVWYSGLDDRTGPTCRSEYSSWPPENVETRTFYLRDDGALSEQPPYEKNSRSHYLSDPASPVPFMESPQKGKNRDYMASDQSFLYGRSDVLTFTGKDLKDTIVAAGPVDVRLFVSTTASDSDFIVKVLDNGVLVRWDVVRARYRNSFEHPVPMERDSVHEIRFTLADIAHIFLPGDKISVQIQSTWYPLVDINPQKYVRNIYAADEGDFVEADICIYHQKKMESSISFRALK